jgi:hypothetical protein
LVQEFLSAHDETQDKDADRGQDSPTIRSAENTLSAFAGIGAIEQEGGQATAAAARIVECGATAAWDRAVERPTVGLAAGQTGHHPTAGQADRVAGHERHCASVSGKARGKSKRKPGKDGPASSRFYLSDDRCSGASPKQMSFQKPKPPERAPSARFDWGLGAVCFGASPVAAVFGSAPGGATPREHRSQFTKGEKAPDFGYFFKWPNRSSFGYRVK